MFNKTSNLYPYYDTPITNALNQPQSNQNSSNILDHYLQPSIVSPHPDSQPIDQSTQTLICADDANHFQTFNQGIQNNSDMKQSIQENSLNKRRFRLWSTGNNNQQKKQSTIGFSNKNQIKKGHLVMIARKPLQEINNINRMNTDNFKKQQNCCEQKRFQEHCQAKEQFLKPIYQSNKSIGYSSKQSAHSNQDGKCSCQQFDKLLQITSRCVDYYNTFVTEKDEELRIVRQAFIQIQSNLESAFNSIIDEIKTKQNQIVSFLHSKEHQLFETKDKQEQKLKIGLQQIRAIHLSNFLMRNGVEFSEKDKSSIFSLEQSLENSKQIIFQKSVSEDIHNYAKTLHGFYEAMQDIEKNCFKETVDETINFINNLITEEIKFIVYEKIPQKSMNCSFSFNNNSIESGKLFGEQRKLLLSNFDNLNNFSLSSPSIATKLEFSEPTSPKGQLLRLGSACGELLICENLKSKQVTETGIQTFDEQGSYKIELLSQIGLKMMGRGNRIESYRNKLQIKDEERWKEVECL